MKLNFYRIIEKPRKPALLLVLLVIIAGFNVALATADWSNPIMGDYVKIPVFASTSVKPNIMIMLDNSGSMNELAYDTAYKGVPYNLAPKSFSILAGIDDMAENASGSVKDGEHALAFGTDCIGLRFQNVTVPKGATISSARIVFTAKNNWSAATQVDIKGQASDNATFMDVDIKNNISDRPTTTVAVSWSPGPWENGKSYATPDLSAIVNEIVHRSGWADGNAMLFRVAGSGFPGTLSGHREAYSQESDPHSAPVLYIEFIDQSAGTRYYGYFNPNYFYRHSSNVFFPAYKKVEYVPSTNSWKVKTLAGVDAVLTDGDIAPAIKSNGLWDGNWMNWLSMRRVDVMRKVLMGGKATSRTGGGNQQNQAESAVGSNYAVAAKTFNSAAGPATSPYKGSVAYEITRKGEVKVSSALYTLSIQKDIKIEPDDFFEGNLAGVLQRIGERARWGNMWFNTGTGSNQSGGHVQNQIDNGFGTNFLPGLQNKACNTWTPLAETYYVAMQYFAQEPVAAGLDFPNQAQLFNIGKNTNKDPYWDKSAGQSVPCAKSFVLLLTDGASTKDSKIPSQLKGFATGNSYACDESTGTDCPFPSGGTDYLADLALYARTTNLREDLQGDQNLILYTILAFEDDPNARSLLMDAARNGGFDDLNGDGKPNGTYSDPDHLRLEWDQDGDGIPDTYFEASDGYLLEKQLLSAINSILRRASSGTAASVVSNTRSGEGAVYQSIFYPAITAGASTVNWVGQVHSLFTDAYGNIREDTNGNKKLDLGEDLFIVFEDDKIFKYKDSNANGMLDEEDEGPLSLKVKVEDKEIEKSDFQLNEIRFIWSSNEWLNQLPDATVQRPYTSTTPQRYIFTFVDADGNMAASENEIQAFSAESIPLWTQVADPSNFYAYIHAYTPFNPPIATTHTDFKDMVRRQTGRIVNFIRGEDQGYEEVGSVPLSAFRNRKIDYNGDGVLNTWRLGDIVHSTPTVVGRPAEKFDLIYRDKGYAAFVHRYRYRRNVIYTGANDGMIHAFNSGFYNSATKGFAKTPFDNLGLPVTAGGPYHAFDLGAELWAYVPFNLLPHLHWLADPAYQHIYYNDLQPRIFDARIYPDKGPDDPINPNGWATVMVTGMRFGGGKIAADIDKTDGPFNPAVDKVMSSAYVIFDITHPEQPPKLLGEIAFPELGFTTCHPGVIPMRGFKAETHSSTGKLERTETTNQWYLIFGSGPISKDGAGHNGANTSALIDGTSSQQAVLYAVDLVELANNNKVVALTAGGKKTYAASSAGTPHYLVRLEETESSVSKPIAVDWDLDFNTDTVYFGISHGNHQSGWKGKMRRIVMENDTDPTVPANWTVNSTLLDVGQPIMASATAGVDGLGNRWLFFGTGRFYSQADKFDTQQQSFYGIKEPYDNETGENKFTYTTVGFNTLLDVTKIELFENADSLSNYMGSFENLKIDIEDSYQGWRMNFDYQSAGERNLGEAVLAGDILTFTTYVPSDDPCSIGGESLAYALYYRTGTAYQNPVIGVDQSKKDADGNALVLKRGHLGSGMTTTPNIHVGREDGSQAHIQTSTGAIKPVEQQNPGVLKSGKLPFKPGDQTCP
jgi:Tfp pilus tip-associated adhesin PilY1